MRKKLYKRFKVFVYKRTWTLYGYNVIWRYRSWREMKQFLDSLG